MLAASILLAAIPLGALAQSTPAPSATPISAPSPLPTPSPSPSGSPNSYVSVGFRGSSITLPYGSASSPRGAFINFLLQFNANNAMELHFNGDSFGVNPAGATNGGSQTPPPPNVGATPAGSPSPIAANLGSSLNRLEVRYYVMPRALNFALGAGFASFTNGSQLPQYPSLSGFGIGAALLPTGSSPLFGSIFFYPSLAGSSGGTRANAVTYRAGLHIPLPSSSLFGELGFDGETLQAPSGGPTPSVFSYNKGTGGSQTRNAITLGIGVKF